MNLTYIIGNGFDLGLGLKTRYTDFINDFLDIPIGRVEFMSFAKARLRDRIIKDSETWADAEMAFAKLDFSSMFANESDRDKSMLKLIYSFKDDLGRYLLNQQKQFFPKGMELRDLSIRFKDRIVKSIYEGYAGLGLINDRGLELVDRRENNYVNVINFNYTYTFDFLFRGGTDGSYEIPFVSNLEDGTQLKLNVGRIHHVHGSLSGKDTLFGVSVSSQIDDSMMRSLASDSGVLVKPAMDKEENGYRYGAALEDLSNSDAIVIFGVSFGKSDKFWWREISQLLARNNKLRIFIFPHANVMSPVSTVEERSMLRAEWRGKLFSSVRPDMNDNEISQLEDSISRVVVLPYGLYTKHNGEKSYGDPWDLSYFSDKVIMR